LIQALTYQLRRMTGVIVPSEAWQPDALPDHLRMNVRMVAADGDEVGMGRDIQGLQREQGDQAAETFAQLPGSDFERERVMDWDFGELPPQVEFQQHGMHLMGYPALVDEGDHVALRLLDSPIKARAAMRAGLRRLFMLQSRERIKYVEKNLPDIQSMCLHYVTLGDCAGLRNDLITAIADHAFLADRALPCNAEEFQHAMEAGAAQLQAAANEICGWAGEALARYHGLVKRLKGAISPAGLKARGDIQDQMRHLLYPGFITATPFAQLCHLGRYLKAIELRLAKLEQHPGRDGPLLAQIAPLWQACLERAEKQRHLGVSDPALEEFRWLLEELRVSLFAQELKTAQPVSVKRLSQQWGTITS
jgi:ATP-dependent helicase HrpA